MVIIIVIIIAVVIISVIIVNAIVIIIIVIIITSSLPLLTVSRLLDGFRVFEEFLKTEYSDNNLSFWVSVEEFREEKEDILITEMAQDIYETYISSLSPNEVNYRSIHYGLL